MNRSRAEWLNAQPTSVAFSEVTVHLFTSFAGQPVSSLQSHEVYCHVPPVAVCAKWNLRFNLIDIPRRNMYKRAHDDHLHHLALIFTDDP